MKVFTKSLGNLTTWWPLAGSNTPGTLRVAGQVLKDLQWGEMRAAGLTQTDQEEDADFIMHAHAWVDRNDWALFQRTPNAAKLKSPRGTLLATRKTNEDDILEAVSSFGLVHPWDILRLNEELVGKLTTSQINGDLSLNAYVEGVLILGRGSRILPGVYIEGNVIIGDNCKIGPNCHLRGNTTIGDNCHIGQAVEIKNSLLGSNTHVGHLSYVGDSVVGSHVNFGAGTLVSNLRHDGKNHRTQVDGWMIDTGRRKLGVVMGDGVHTGIHTSIYPGRKIGQRASTRPAAVVLRDLRDDEIL